MRTAVPLWESSWSAACGSSSPSKAKLSCIRPRTHSLTCRPEGFSLGGNPLLFPPEKSGTEQRRTRLARANSDWENELGATGPCSQNIPSLSSSLSPSSFVLLIILAFVADFTGKSSANLWQFAALVGGWIGGMLSAIGIIPTD